MTQNAGSEITPSGRPSPWRLLMLPALGIIVATALGLGPHRQFEPAAQVAEPAAACGGEGFVLPPGHPPIEGYGRGEMRLPPGHPPIDGRSAGFMRPAPPLAPSFEAPKTVDI
jgi:hypothetical protein